MPIDYTIPAKIGQLRTGVIDPFTLANLREQVAARRAQGERAAAEYDQQNTLRRLLPQTVARAEDGSVSVVPDAARAYLQAGGSANDLKTLVSAYSGQQELPQWTRPVEVPTVKDGVEGTLLISPAGREFIAGKPSAPKAQPQQKAPAGYRFKPDGTLEAIPGGPAMGGGAKVPTESQQKYSLYAQTLSDALPPLESLYSAGYRPSAAALKLIAMDPTAWTTSGLMSGMSPQDLEWVSIVNNVADSIVRPRSGAAITAGDVANTISGYIPLPSENATTRQRKMANLKKQQAYLSNIAAGRTASNSGPGEITIGSEMVNPSKKGAPKVDLSKLIPR